ncbi:TPA: dATP/dGTP pyrophosphohydrolase domain-containing protein [Salmonella enterica subsp. enterica serovar Muenchen]
MSDGDRVPANRRIPLYRHAKPVPERERIRREHAEWSDATFGDVGPVGTLKHLSKEALEAAAEPEDLSEWADMQFLLWDAQRRAGISDEQITQAMVEKLAVNKQREWPEPKDGEPRLHIKDMPAPVMPADLHPDTQNLAANFCTALAEKLYGAQLKYGYDADWKQDGWHTQCLAHFHQHIAKGDPRDVAAYCAFMWYHGWKTESVSGPVVPEEMPKGLAGQIVSLLAHNIGDKLLAQKIWNACRAVMLQSKYRDLSQPADPQISEYEKIMLQAGNSPVIPDGYTLVPVEPTDEMIVAAMDSDDVTYNESDDTVFYVHHCEIYKAMLAAAPQPEASDGK